MFCSFATASAYSHHENIARQASPFAGKTEAASDAILYPRYYDIASVLQVCPVGRVTLKSHFAALPLTSKTVQEPHGTADEIPTLTKASGKKRKALDLEAAAVDGDPRPGVLLCRLLHFIQSQCCALLSCVLHRCKTAMRRVRRRT